MPEFEPEMDLLMEDIAARKLHERWANWVAFSSSALAVMAAIVALLGSYAANDTLITETEKAIQMSLDGTDEIRTDILEMKGAIFAALGKPLSQEDIPLLERKLSKEIPEHESAVEKEAAFFGKEMRAHHIFSISVTLFQIGIILGSLAIIARRRKVWRFSLILGALGLAFGIWGVTAFV